MLEVVIGDPWAACATEGRSSRALSRVDGEVGRQRVLRVPSRCATGDGLWTRAGLARKHWLLQMRFGPVVWQASLRDLAE